MKLCWILGGVQFIQSSLISLRIIRALEIAFQEISRMLGSHEYMTLVIYGLGSFEFDVKSQYQLAFALLLKEDKIFPVGDIELYDPALSPADVKSCFDLGIRVLLVNEQCHRRVEKPTIFYVPGLKFVGNLIEANLSPKHLNKMILVSYGFKDGGESISGEFENWNCGCTRFMGFLSLERDRFLLAGFLWKNLTGN